MTPCVEKWILHAPHNDLLNDGALRPGDILPLGKGHVGLAQYVHRESGALFWRQEKALAERSRVGNSEAVDAGTGE